jgi:glutathione S-transferase
MPFDLAVTRSKKYLAVHPLGRVPCLRDGELRLFESGAIIEHLCERHPDRGLGRPAGDPERYEWLQWIHYAETMAVHAAALVQQLHFIDADQRSATLFDLESRRLAKAVGVVDSQLAGRDFLLRTGFSAADVAVGYSVHLAQRFLRAGKWRQVEEYYHRLRARPAFVASLPQGWTQPLTWLNV